MPVMLNGACANGEKIEHVLANGDGFPAPWRREPCPQNGTLSPGVFYVYWNTMDAETRIGVAVNGAIVDELSISPGLTGQVVGTTWVPVNQGDGLSFILDGLDSTGGSFACRGSCGLG
jgi:hypothetical protein